MAAVELVRDDDLHHLPHTIADQPDDEVDHGLLVLAIVAALILRLLVLHEPLDSFADELHDGVDDALLFEVAVPSAAPTMVVMVALVTVVLVTIVTVAAVTLTVVTVVSAAFVSASVVATMVAPIVIAVVTVVARTFMPFGPRSDQALERLQSFENLTPIVVSHG